MVKRLLLTVTMLAGMSTSSDTNFFNDKGKELLSYWDPAAFENLKGLLLQVMEYDTKAIASWGVDGMNAMKTPITTPICGFTDGYMIQAKTATYIGRFEVVDNRWVRVGDTDGMEFHFTDKNGKDCLVKITTSGETKVITVPYEKDEDYNSGDDDEGDEEGGIFESKAIKDYMSDVNVVALEVPEHAECTVTQAGLQVMSFKADIDLSYFTDEWSAKDGYAFNILFSVAKSASARTRANANSGNYDIALNYKYNPAEGIAFSAAVKVSDKSIASFNLNADGTLNLDEGFISIFGENSGQFHDMGIKSILAELDVLGAIQAKLAIPDFATFTQHFSGLSSLSMETEDDAKKVSDVLNEQMSIRFYYDHSDELKGWIGFIPSYEEDYEFWNAEPTIYFTSDNSTQSAMEFFSKENMPDVFDTVSNIYEEINEMAATVKKKMEEIDIDATKIMAVTKEKGIYYDGENVQLLGQKPGSSAEIYTMGGVLCARVKVGDDGKAALPYSLLPNDVYIIRTASGTQKFFKR